MQAKAKRLARFKVELSEPAKRSSIIAEPKFSSVHHDLSMVQERKFIRETFNDVTGDFPPGSFDNGDVESSSNIVGLCPDMCPGMLLQKKNSLIKISLKIVCNNLGFNLTVIAKNKRRVSFG